MTGGEFEPFVEIDPAVAFDWDQPVAILSDLHANAEALETVLRWLDARRIRQVLVLGDLVGYGASPRSVLQAVRDRRWPVVRGNHDTWVLGRLPPEDGIGNVKERALATLVWAQERITQEDRDFLRGLPSILRLPDLGLAVHGSLVDPHHCFAYIYDLSLDLNIRRLKKMEPPQGGLVFFGHTHRPAAYRVYGDGWESLPPNPGPLELSPRHLHFINPGSVGYPRDGDLRAAFLLLHGSRRQIELVRLPYDSRKTLALMERAEFPAEMIRRLGSAR